MAFEEITQRLENLDLGQLRETALADIRSGKKTRRQAGVRILRAVDGLQRAGVQPRDLIITKVPVMPAAFRPYTMAGNTFIPGDANELYSDLIKSVKIYEENRALFGAQGSTRIGDYVRKAVRSTYGYEDSPNPKIAGRKVSGLLTKILGSNPKTSWVQQKLIAKPQDYVGRGVISPNPKLGMDEVEIPEGMAWDIFDSHVRRRLASRGVPVSRALKLIKDRDPMARRALDDDMKSRPVLISRAPAWHKHNFVSSYAKIGDGENIHINTFISAGLNADYDGDSLDLETPIILRRDGETTLLTGRQIAEQFSEGDGNEIICPEGFEAWTYSGWSRVVNFSFHACHEKRKYRVVLRNGIKFTVSEDHSIMVGGQEKKPDQITLGTAVDISSLRTAAGEGGTYEEGVVYGHFMGDGCAEIRSKGSGRISIACKPDVEREYLKDLWRDQFGSHLTDSGHGWFQLTDVKLARHFLEMCGRYCTGKKIHAALMTKSEEFLKGLLAGYILSDGSVETTHSGSYLVRTWSRSQGLRDSMSLVASILGLPHALRKRKAKGESNYIISFGKEAIKLLDYRCPGKKGDRLRQALSDYVVLRKDDRASLSVRGAEVVSISEVNYSDRMIDLEVESGEHVFSIIGGVVLHNTMSVHAPALPEAVKDAKEKLLPSKMLFSIRNRDTTLPQPKHEQLLGLASAQLNPSAVVHRFNSREEALSALGSGVVKLHDRVDIPDLTV